MDDSRGGDAHHVVADAGLRNERSRVLKHADTFAVFDQYGDMHPADGGETGLYHDGTRFLSRFEFEVDGARPFLLSSTVRDDNDQLVVALTNPDFCRDGEVYLPMGSLHFAWRKLLWKGAMYQELRIENHSMIPASFTVTVRFAADYADIYEVRGMRRTARGQDRPPEAAGNRAVLGYSGLDGVLRRTVLRCTPAPTRLTPACAAFDLSLKPGQATAFSMPVACELVSARRRVLTFDRAKTELAADILAQTSLFPRLDTENGQANALFRRGMADLQMLTTALPTGPYPYAGIPWFNTPFGRDGLITAFECLWMNPSLARGVLAYLAQTQATDVIPEQDAEPGKILHETRNGEMAAVKEMPFASYYGSVDATLLFVILAEAYFERTGEIGFIEEIWPNIEAALCWMERWGDRDGDGFIEYDARNHGGLLHQGWKDSDDAIFHADGKPARGPIAVCEVQAYAYTAWLAGARLASVLRKTVLAANLHARAEQLKTCFEDVFWCDDLGTYALALDGQKRTCRVRASNAGHALFARIAAPERAAAVARQLLRPEFFSGWGVRTLASGEVRYNPMGYHTGSVWPHDNALIAYGMAQYGLSAESQRIFTGIFDAATYCDLHRIPELFCGFWREPGEGPIRYPVACSPQAWSAGAAFLMLQGCLGLTIRALQRKISFVRPSLPPFLKHLRIANLRLGDATADLQIARHRDATSVHVVHLEGDVEVLVQP